jgi:serine/threonine-protein kinase
MGHGGVEIGAVLANRYLVERVLGQGGMGIVVQAMHLQLHQPVAMKFLLPEVLGNHQVVQRFLREAQAAVRLKSEHVARVIDVGSIETGAPYMVLEYLEGADLSSFPRSELPVGGIIDLMLQACEALAEAHSLGIVHRDIKPANFFITRRTDGTLLLKVLDFGISKLSATNGQLTATQTVMGTPAYMSPEQMRSSRDVDHRSDIWSLGVVLYELLQGVPPFGGDTFSSMVLKVVADPLPKLTVSLPGDLDSVVYRCLEKEPARRFQSIAEFAHAIAKYARSETQAAISVQRTRGIAGTELPYAALKLGGGHPAFPSTISGSVGARTMPQQRSGRRWPIIAAVVALTGVIVTAAVAVSGNSKIEGELPSMRPEGRPKAAPEPRPDATKPVSQPSIATTPITAPSAVANTPPSSPPQITRPTLNPAATMQPPLAPATKQPDTPATTQVARPASIVGVPDLPAATTPASPPTKKPRKPTNTSASHALPTADDVLGARN